MLHWSFLVTRGAEAATLEVGPSSQYTTIQAALAEAAPGDVLELAAGTYEGPVQLNEFEIELVGVDGAASTFIVPSSTLPASAATVTVGGGAPVTLRGLSISGGGQQRALAVREGDLFGEDLVLSGAGADISNELSIDSSEATFVGLSIVEPVEHLYLTGGHVEIFLSEVTFESSTFSGASTIDGIGGAIYTYDVDLTFRDCTFTDNSGAEGGAVFFESLPSNLVTFEDTLFERNHATSGPGGALFQLDGQLVMTRTTLRDSSSSEEGGTLTHVDARQFTFQDGLVERGAGETGGGLVLLNGLNMTVQRSSFLSNTSLTQGGGLLILSPTGEVDVGGNLFCLNEAVGGGGMQLTGVPDITADIHHNRFVTNEASLEGAALSLVGMNATVAYNTFVDSLTEGERGALYAGGGAIADSLNNAFAYNQGVGAFSVPPAGVNGGYNLYFGNDVNLGTPEGGQNDASWSDVLQEPEFMGYVPGDCTSNLRPGPGSPLVDAGDPSILDDDGTRSDIGAYGGAGATSLLDVDGDGIIEGDCAPYDPEKVTGSEEIVADGVDQDCDGQDLCWVDGDGDGVGISESLAGAIGCEGEGLASVNGDCDDTNAELAADCSVVDPGEQDDPQTPDAPDLRPAWFCSTAGAAPLPPIAWALGLWLLVRRSRETR